MEIIGVLITGLLGGLLFVGMQSVFGKMQGKGQKNRVGRRIRESVVTGNVNKSDLYDVINYFTNVDDKENECDQYIEIADKFFPNDKAFDIIIVTYNLQKNQFSKASARINTALVSNQEDSDYLYLKGLINFKEGDIDLAKKYQDKAISINPKLASKKYIK